MCGCMVTKYSTVEMKKVTIRMVNPCTGCFSFCHGARSMPTTQAGDSQEASAANIRIASAAYSSAKN